MMHKQLPTIPQPIPSWPLLCSRREQVKLTAPSEVLPLVIIQCGISLWPIAASCPTTVPSYLLHCRLPQLCTTLLSDKYINIGLLSTLIFF